MKSAKEVKLKKHLWHECNVKSCLICFGGGSSYCIRCDQSESHASKNCPGDCIQISEVTLTTNQCIEQLELYSEENKELGNIERAYGFFHAAKLLRDFHIDNLKER